MESRVFSTEIGWAGIAASEGGIIYSVLPARKKKDVIDILKSVLGGKEGIIDSGDEVERRLIEFYNGESKDLLDVKLDLKGVSQFKRLIYNVVRTIPRGGLMKYGEIASMVGSPGGARAVGRALKENPVPPFIPCHRVVGHDGGLIGFGAVEGIELKKRLLEMEGIDFAEDKAVVR